MDAAEIDRQLDELEKKGEHLRAMYEQYFLGIERLEPLVHKKDVERRIKVLRKEQIRNTAQRFKFNTLVARFNTMQQHWGRVVREIENGTYKRDVMRAAARFGDVALPGGRKSKEVLAAAAAATERMRTIEDSSYELAADDIIEEQDEEDEAPTPPKLGELPHAVEAPQPAPFAAAPKPSLGPQVGGLRALSASRAPPSLPAASTITRTDAATGASSPAAGAPPGQRAAGLRWGGGGAPAEPAKPAGEVKRRVAELAAQLTARRSNVPSRGVELDLEADRPPPSRPGGAPAPRPLGQAVASAPTATPSAPSGFGVIDVGVDEAPAPAAPQRPPVTRPAPAAATASRAPLIAPKPTAPPSHAEGDLGDQRIRQIYAKYVETKRSTQESTAGVTYDKLAATLRAQADKLKSAHPNRSVDYEVVVKDGKTHLKPVLR
jgi:hypothetical protein